MKETNKKNGNDPVFSDELVFNDLDQGDKELVERVIRKGYTRRDTLKLMMATGVTMAAAQNLLSTGGVAMAQTPKKGGSVKAAMSLHGPDDQLDPTLFTSAIDYSRGRAHYNGLCQLDDNMSPQPELAESFEPNSNATEWTFKLRKNVNFHDGAPFTADDVIWSMNRHLGEDSTSVIKDVVSSIKE